MRSDSPKHGKQVPGNPHPDTPYIIYEGEVEALKTINDNLPSDELEMDALRIFGNVSDRRVSNTIDDLERKLWGKAFAPYGACPQYNIIPWSDVKQILQAFRTEANDK